MTAAAGLPRPFWLLWAGVTLTSLGDGVRLVTFPLLAARLTFDPAVIALVTVAMYLPALAVGPFAGVMVDRSRKRNTILTANATRVVVLLALAWLAWSEHATVLLLCIFAFVYGSADALENPASHAILPRLVDHDALSSANSRLQSGQIAAEMFVGRALGGTLFGLAAWSPMLTSAILLMLASSFIFRLPREPAGRRQPSAEAAIWREAREGIVVVTGSRLLRRMSVLVAFWAGASGAFWGVATLYALGTLQSGASGYGVMLALSAVGSLVGAAFSVRIVRRAGAGLAAILAVTLSSGSILALGFTDHLWSAAALLAVNGLGVTVWNVISVTVRQANVPPELLGRVASSYRILATAAMPLGAAAAGLIAGATSVPFALAITGLTLGAAGGTVLPGLSHTLSRTWPRGASSAELPSATRP